MYVRHDPGIRRNVVTMEDGIFYRPVHHPGRDDSSETEWFQDNCFSVG